MDSDHFLSSLFNQVTLLPPTPGPYLALGITLLLLLASGFVSAAEVAFFSLKPTDINRIKESEEKVDLTIRNLLKRSQYLLASILIANNFINVAIVMLCTFSFHLLFDFSSIPWLGFLFETVILTFLLLLFGEIMPKIYAQLNPLHFVRLSANTLHIIEYITFPLSTLLVHSTSIIKKIKTPQANELSVDELSKALELTSTEISDEKNMLEEIIKFYNKTASEIMTSRLDMNDVDITLNFKKLIAFIVDCRFSRIPVYAKTEDNIKGILYIKDLIPYLDKSASFHWQTLIRSAYFVPETKKIDDLLEEFRLNKIHMAIVVDEFGGTSGIVTMEDILEEIVGDITDENDDEEKLYNIQPDGSIIFEAKISLNDFYRIANVEPEGFGKLTDEVETLAGLLLETKGNFPKKDEKIKISQYCFQVLGVDKRRIFKIKFSRLES